MNNTAQNIERLLQFGVQHKLIAPLDVFVARNTLLDLFGLAEPYEGAVPKEHFDTPTELLELLLDDAAEKELFDNEVPALRVNFEARIMGALMPRESEVAARFNQLWKTEGKKGVFTSHWRGGSGPDDAPSHRNLRIYHAQNRNVSRRGGNRHYLYQRGLLFCGRIFLWETQ